MAALTHMNGSLSLYHRLLGRYLGEYRSLDADIAEAQAGGDLETALRMAHTLKGMAGSLGARRLEHAAAEVETALHQGQLPALERLHQAQAQSVEAIEALLASLPAPQAPTPLPAGALEELERLLREQDADAKEAFAALEARLQALYPAHIARLSVALDNYDFDTALAALQAIRHERSLESSDRETQ